MTATGFCIRFACAVVALGAMVAIGNAVVDPYLLFGAPRWPGFNARKPAADVRERMIKAYDAPRHTATTLILGSSRSDIGLDPAQAAWPADARPVYNLSVAGTDARGAWRYLQHFLAERADLPAPRTILVGLDFEYFLAPPDAATPDAIARALDQRRASETEQRLAVSDDGRPNAQRTWRALQDRAAALLSLDALSDSLATVAANLRHAGADVGVSGHLSDDVLRATVASDGVATLFAQKDTQTIAQYAMPHQVLRATVDSPITGMVAIDDLIAIAHARGMRVVLFVQPAHADRLELLDRMGYWDDYEQWKVALTERVAASRARGGDVRLFDFGGYEHFSQEIVPQPSDRATRLQWFWEPAHYTTALGALMVERMFTMNDGANDDAHVDAHDREQYGVELEPGNVQGRLMRIRQDRMQYRADFPAEVKRLRALYCSKQRCEAER